MPRGRGHGPRMSNEKAKDFKGTMKKLMAYLSAYKIGIFFVIVFAIGSTIFNIVGPKILGKATTEIFKGLVRKVSGGAGIDFDKIAHIVLTLLCLYLASAVFSFVQGYIMTGVSQKLTYRLRKEISEKINRLPMNYFDKQTHGEVLSRITNDIDTLSQSLNQSATQVITSVTTIIGVLIMMLSISPLMTLVALLILPVSMGLISMIVKRSQKYFMSQQEYLGHVNGQVEEIYGGHNIIKAFNKEEDVIATFKRDNDILYTSAWKSQFLSGMMMPIMQFVGNLGYVGEVILGGYLAMKGTIQVGDIQSFIQYVRSFTQPIQQVAQVANMLQSTAAASERVFDFLEEAEEDQTVEHPVCIDEMEGSVSFEHVHFGYNPDHTIINDFSVDVKSGQKVAIVGPTGAGKSTVVNLISRFYNINDGRVLIDGYDISKVTLHSLRSQMGIMLQDSFIFSGTIKDNVRYGRLDATDEEIVKACETVCANEFIEEMPDGYDTVVTERGGGLSQGQKQLIAFARTLLSDPKILILDEATSSIDTKTERQLQIGLNKLLEGRTSFIIAHRLSTIRNCDRIMYVSNQGISECGSHDELMAVKGDYYKLYTSQIAG